APRLALQSPEHDHGRLLRGYSFCASRNIHIEAGRALPAGAARACGRTADTKRALRLQRPSVYLAILDDRLLALAVEDVHFLHIDDHFDRLADARVRAWVEAGDQFL